MACPRSYTDDKNRDVIDPDKLKNGITKYPSPEDKEILYRLVWATKLLLAAIVLVFPALGLGYKSFNCSMYHVPVPTLIENFA